MLDRRIVLLMIFFVSLGCFAQKPKKTHNHEKFASKAMMSLAYIHKMCLDDAALAFVSEKSGVPMEALKVNKEKNIETLNEDIKFITDNGIYGAMTTVELSNIRETPLKMADIVVNYKNKVGNFQYVLTNCVQTNISWYMGDGIDVRGDGVQDIIAKRAERKERAEGGILAKMKQIEENQQTQIEAGKKQGAYVDSLNTSRTGYFAQVFQMKGIDKSTKYYNYDWTNMPLKGYYVKKDGSIVDAVIAYRVPELMVGRSADMSNLFICKEANDKKLDVLNIDNEQNFKEFVQKSDIQAFFVGGQLFANIDNVGWRVVLSEGAIHTFANIEKIGEGGSTNYQAFVQTQKLEEQPLGSILGGASKNVILDMMEDSPELADLYRKDELTQLEAIVKFNHWYDLNTPSKVKYIPTK